LADVGRHEQGIELSLTDAVALAMLAASRGVKCPWQIKAAFLVYALGFVISTLTVSWNLASVFYGWQVVRTIIVFYAVARASVTDTRVPEALLTGLIVGITSQALFAAYEFAGGNIQAGGSFGHQNLLGMMTHFIVYPAFALFLAGYHVKRTALALVAGLIVAYTGGSRATIGLMAVGLVMTLIVSSHHRLNGRKMAVAVATLLSLAAVTPILYSAIERRSVEQRGGSSEERERMKVAASMIISDNPLGAGANRYVTVSNVGGYTSRAGVAWTSSAAPVHSTFYLVTAEMGWIGLIGFVTILLAGLVKSRQASKRASGTLHGEYATGLAVTFVMVAIHSQYEWITMLYLVHIPIAFSLGIVAAGAARAKKAGPVAERSRALIGPDLR